MWSRKRIDIDFKSLAFGLFRCIVPRRDTAVHEKPESLFAGSDHSLVCLSVRTGFDLLLDALKLPEGSEVLMTAITVPNMIEIVRSHGLVPVPLDLEPGSLSVAPDAVRQRMTPRTRMIVMAHLFGVRIPLEPVIRVARQNGLFVVEDCAQAFDGRGFTGSERADASLFSFGPIKSATALGGAMMRVNDKNLLSIIRSRHERFPLQAGTSYALRLVKYATLKMLACRSIYGLIFRLMKDADRQINSLARNFGNHDLFERIRKRPCAALTGMVTHRWQSYPRERIHQRTSLGNLLASSLVPYCQVPGHQADYNSYWVFPVVSGNPDWLIHCLREHGFDATQGHSLTIVDPPTEDDIRSAPVATRMLKNTVFVPIYPELSTDAINRMAFVIVQCEQEFQQPEPLCPA